MIGAVTQLFADADFDAVTIARVADAAGVYIYFATKEALFLDLVRGELLLWLDGLVLKLRRLRATSATRCLPPWPAAWRNAPLYVAC